jgi:hypothetical protein
MSDEITPPITNPKISSSEDQGQPSTTPANVIPPEECWGEIDRNVLSLDEEECINVDWLAAFGADLGKAVMQIAEGASCSPEAITLNLSVLASTILGNKISAKISNGWLESIHLWGCLVGELGSKKSASMKPFDDALKPLQQKRKLQYAEQKNCTQIKLRTLKSKPRAEMRTIKA